MTQLLLQVLGAPHASYAGQPLSFRSRRAFALLIYLAVEPAFHTRDHLAALLWPDAEQAHSRMLLRSAIALLRQSLSAVGFNPEQVLVLEKDRVRLERTAIDIDLVALEQALQSLEHNVAMANMPEAGSQAQLFDAIHAYRGDFLQGFSLDGAPEFDDWISLQCERQHQCMHAIFEQLVAMLSAQGQKNAALEMAARWVRHDQLHEAAHEQLIRLYMQNGNRTEAINAYQRYASVLERELKIAPNTAIRALIDQSHVPPQTAPVLIHQTTKLKPSMPRTNQLEALSQRVSQALDLSREGQTHILVLEHTRPFNHEFRFQLAQWVEAKGADLLFGHTYNLGGRVPYQVISEFLRERIEQERAPDDVLPDPWLAELSRLVPDLCDRYPDLPTPLSDEATSTVRLYEAVARLIAAFSNKRPVVIWIDNIHWADSASLDLLHYTVRRWAADGVPVLLVYTMQTVATGIDRPAQYLNRSLAQLDQDVPVTFVPSPSLPIVRSGQGHRALAA